MSAGVDSGREVGREVETRFKYSPISNVPRAVPVLRSARDSALRERHRSDASSSAPFGGGEAVSDYATRRSNPRPFNRWVIIISGTMHNLPRCTNFN